MYVCGVVECVSLWNSLWSGLVWCCRPSSAVVAVALLPEACCHVCMYVWPTGTEILLVVLFWRPDLTLLLWLIGDIVQKVSSVFFRHTTCIQTGYHTYIHIRMRQLLARRVCMYVCMYVCMACGWLAALPVRCGYLSGTAPSLLVASSRGVLP